MTQVTRIKPPSRWEILNVPELIAYHEVFWALAMRSFKLRYAQSLIGGGWAVLQPFTTMVVFSVIFGNFAQIPSQGIPYPLFSYSGLLLWTFIQNSLNTSSASLVNHRNMVTKVYFPRIIIPISTIIVNGIDYLIALCIMAGMMWYFDFAPGISILWLPVVWIITIVIVSGWSALFAALNVQYRDIKFAIPFILQLMFFITPIIYPPSMLKNWEWVAFLNPLTGIVEAHRAALLNHQAFPVTKLAISLIVSLIFLIIGLIYFNKVDRVAADKI